MSVVLTVFFCSRIYFIYSIFLGDNSSPVNSLIKE